MGAHDLKKTPEHHPPQLTVKQRALVQIDKIDDALRRASGWLVDEDSPLTDWGYVHKQLNFALDALQQLRDSVAPHALEETSEAKAESHGKAPHVASAPEKK